MGKETVRVDVEFLAPKGAKMKKNQPNCIPGFRVLEADGCALAFDDPETVTIEGKTPDERRNRVSIRVASVETPAATERLAYSVPSVWVSD